VQLTWGRISDFLFKRFSHFPEKLRDGDRVHTQWPEFGKNYGQWFHENGQKERSVDAVMRYICSVESLGWLKASNHVP
jgi:hypothetical protein